MWARRIVVTLAILATIVVLTPIAYIVYLRATQPKLPPLPPPYAWVMLGDPAEFKVGNLLFKVPRAFVYDADLPMAVDGFDKGTPVFISVFFVGRWLPDGGMAPKAEPFRNQPPEDGDVGWLVGTSTRAEILPKLSPSFLARHVEHGASSRRRPGLTQYFGGYSAPYYGVVDTGRRTTEVMIDCVQFVRHGCLTPVNYSVPIWARVGFQYVNLDHWDAIIRDVFVFMETHSTEVQKN